MEKKHHRSVQGKLSTNDTTAEPVPLLSMIYETQEPLRPNIRKIWVAVLFCFLIVYLFEHKHTRNMKSNAIKIAELMERRQLRLEEFLSAIESHSSIFKVIPDSIGKIIWCDTTNSETIPQDLSQHKQKLYEKRFKGIDYFVGTEGFAEIHFEGSRDNIVKNQVHRFDSFSELLSNRTIVELNFVNVGTRWNFCFFGHPDEKGYTKEALEYVNNCAIETKETLFLEKIEDAWTSYKTEQLNEQYEETGEYLFNLVLPVKESLFWGIIQYIRVGDDYFVVNDKRFDSNVLAEVYFDREGYIVLKKKTDTLWNTLGFGKKDTIAFHALGNSKLFIAVFLKALKAIFHDSDYDLRKK